MLLKLSRTVAVFLFINVPAFAGTEITFLIDDRASPPREQKLYVQDNKIRMDNMGNGSQTIIFNATDKTAYLIEPNLSEYSEITNDDLNALRAVAEQIGARVRAEIEALPPDQKKEAEARYSNLFTASPKPLLRYQKTGRLGSYMQTKCEFIDAILQNRRIEEFCVAKLSDLRLTEDDLKALDSFNNFLSTIIPNQMTFGALLEPAVNELVGYGATAIYLHAVEPDYSMTMTKLVRRQIAPDQFEIPKAFKKTKFM